MEAGYPTGASADAMYYDTSSSRAGWYALAAFVALIVLVIGGVLLFQTLSAEEATDEPTQFVLDDYVDRPLTEVTADLDSKGIRYTTIAEENANFAIGFVHRTDPAAGTLILEEQTVQVYFNPDPQLVPIPQVVGVSLEDARTRLAEAGFEVGEVTTEERDDVAENTVTSSNPPAETAALQGSTVDLVVAAPPASVQVPGEVVGMTELEARGILEAPPFEFVVTTDVRSSPTIPAGTVMEIRPGPGELVQKGGDVLIIVSTGPEPVTVPPVIGRTEAQAVNTLSEAGLVVARVYVDVPAGDLDDGRVIAQSLPASSQVDPGTEITITVAKAVAPVTTLPPTTVAPTTMPPTTVAPTTVAPTTVAPTTDPPASSTP